MPRPVAPSLLATREGVEVPWKGQYSRGQEARGLRLSCEMTHLYVRDVARGDKA